MKGWQLYFFLNFRKRYKCVHKCPWGTRKLLWEQADLQNWTWNIALWESSWTATGWKEHSMVCSQPCQPGTEVSWWQLLTQALFQTQAKRWQHWSMNKQTTHTSKKLEKKGNTNEQKRTTVLIPDNSCVIEVVLRPPPQRGSPLYATSTLTLPSHKGKCSPGPYGPCCRPLSLSGSARDNRFLYSTGAAKRVSVNWSSSRKALWAEKRTQLVVPRHQVIWNKAGRRERKDAVPVAVLARQPAVSLNLSYCSSRWKQWGCFS